MSESTSNSLSTQRITSYCAVKLAIMQPETLSDGDRLDCGFQCGSLACGASLEVRSTTSFANQGGVPPSVMGMQPGAPTGRLEVFLEAVPIDSSACLQRTKP